MARNPFTQSLQSHPTQTQPITQLQAQAAIIAECDALKAFLLDKNLKYGNSALEPLRVFSRASVTEQILVRLDDKLSRLARGAGAGPDEDTVLDMIGYLVLLRVHARLECEAREALTRSLHAPPAAPSPVAPPSFPLTDIPNNACQQICEVLSSAKGAVWVEDLVALLNELPGQVWTLQSVEDALSYLVHQKRVICSYDCVSLAPLGSASQSQFVDHAALTQINLEHGALYNARRNERRDP